MPLTSKHSPCYLAGIIHLFSSRSVIKPHILTLQSPVSREDLLKADTGWAVAPAACLGDTKGGFHGMRKDAALVGGATASPRNPKATGTITRPLTPSSSNPSPKTSLGRRPSLVVADMSETIRHKGGISMLQHGG